MRYISKPKPALSTIATIAAPIIASVWSVCPGSWLGAGVEGESVGDEVGAIVGVGAFGSGTAWGFGAVKNGV